jgi:hypothetical protein
MFARFRTMEIKVLERLGDLLLKFYRNPTEKRSMRGVSDKLNPHDAPRGCEYSLAHPSQKGIKQPMASHQSTTRSNRLNTTKCSSYLLSSTSLVLRRYLLLQLLLRSRHTPQYGILTTPSTVASIFARSSSRVKFVRASAPTQTVFAPCIIFVFLL